MTTTLQSSYSHCQSLAKRTAGNFYYSFLTLPENLFRSMCVLYAFMRITDDLGDDERLPVSERTEQLARWRAHLSRALDGGQFEHDIFPALADVVARHEIPRDYLFAVIDGICMDMQPAGFETFDDLAQYCYHVAGAVGLCCIHIWGFHDDEALDRAVDCGLAFQLTNILRDIREDADNGRVYLPREDLRRFDYTVDDILHHRRDERFTQLMQFQVQRAKNYYQRAEKLQDLLNPAGKPVLEAMMRIYGGLLKKIESRKYDIYSARVQLPAWRKLMIAGSAVVRQRWLGR